MIKNSSVFQGITSIIEERIVDQFVLKVDNIRKEIQENLHKQMSQFYTVLLGEYLAEKSKGYAALTEKYVQYKISVSSTKRRKGRNKGFYRFTGDLIKHLSGRDAEKDFGAAKISFPRGGALADGITYNSVGRLIYKATGRFTKRQGAILTESIVLRIDSFSKLKGATIARISENRASIFDVYPDDIRTKFVVTNFGKHNQRARPLLTPFFKWYGDRMVEIAKQEVL